MVFVLIPNFSVVYKMSKIQFKSKSQLVASECLKTLVVYKMSKIQFKSKSQQKGCTEIVGKGCL